MAGMQDCLISGLNEARIVGHECVLSREAAVRP